MAKYFLNVWRGYMSVEHLADLLDSFGVTCDRKRNGNIWIKAKNKANSDLFEFEHVVYRVFNEHGKPIFNKIDYDFFDHAGCFTADDGSSVLMFSPYWAEAHWPALIKPLWDAGYYVAIFDRNACHSSNSVIIVRKRKDGDEMFDQKSAKSPFYNDTLDYSQYVSPIS